MPRRFLLELHVGGHVLRLTTDPEPITITGERYEPGLSAGPVDVAAMSASVSVSWSPPGGWGAWIGQVGPVDESPAVLLWHRDGEPREECLTLAVGAFVDVGYGGPQDPLVGKIVPSEGEVLMPPPTAAILQDDWATSPESVIGRVPPIILGYPGSRADDGSGDLPAVPALYVSPGGTDFLAIAHGPIGATTCTLTRISGGIGVISKWTGAPVTEEQPGAHVVSVVSNLGGPAPSGFFVDDGEYVLSFDSDTATHGGVVGGGGTVVRGAGEVLRWVLERYSAEGVDVGRWRQHEDWLDSYKIDAFVDKPIGGVDWIRRAILPWLPVRLRRSERGWWLQPHRYHATAADVVRSLSADRGDVQRTSGVATRAEVYNAFSISYRLGRSGRYYSVRNLEGLPGQLQRLPGGTDTRQYGRADLRLSELRFGRRVAPPLQCPITWDTSTAAQVAHDAADEHGWPKRAVQYVGGVELDYLEPGQVVSLTDSDLAAYDVLSLIERVIVDVDQVALDLTFLDGPGDV